MPLDMGLRDRTFGSVHGVGILELDGNLTATIGEIDLLHDQAQIWSGFGDREVAALLTFRRGPSEKLDRLGTVARPDGVLHVGIRPRFVQFMIKRYDDIFPWPIEEYDSVVPSIRSRFGEYADCIVDRDLAGCMN